jgi:hypothetical protein
MSAFSMQRTPDKLSAPTRGAWTHLDEALLRSGVFRYAKPHHDPVIFTTRVWRDAADGSPGYWGFSGCAGCSISICAERRRMTIKQFMATVPIEFGGTKPLEKEPER